MPTFTPVDFDPFAGPPSGGVQTVPGQGGAPTRVIMDMSQPSAGPKLVPVDHDPFVEPKTFVEKLGETWPARAAQALYSAVTLPHDVMTGEAHVPGSPDAQAIPGAVPFGSPESSGERIADLTLLANPISAATRAGAGIFAVPISRKAATPTAAELKTAAKAGYESPAVKDLEVKPQALADFATGLKARINEMGLDDTLAPKTFTILGNVEKVPASAMMTGQNLRTLQKTLGKASMAIDPQERLAATKALIELNKHLENFPANSVVRGSADDFSGVVRRANANYSAAKTAEGLDKKIVAAQLRADSSNSGMNTANAIRQNLRQVLTKPKEARGLSPSELESAQRVVEGSRLDNTLRGAGSFLGGGGGMGAAVTAAIGGAAGGAAAGGIGGAIGATLPLAGYALKALGNRITVRQAQRLEEAVRSRAPLASSMTKYEEKAAAFEKAKNSRTASDLAIASRNLKNNLAGIGINAQMRDLMHYSNQSE